MDRGLDRGMDPGGPGARGRALVAVLAGVSAVLVIAAAWAWLGGRGERPPHKLLVVGWDGATFAMVDPLVAAGRLPNVARLLERGSSAVCESTKVPISSAAWVGAVTGKHPGENGVYSFFEPVEGTYDVELIGSRSNRATPLWRALSAHGLRSIVFNVPVTHPPERIDGVMVSGMLAPLDSDFAHPRGLADELRARGFVPDLGAWREKQEVSFERVEQQLAVKEGILLEMLRREDWDFAMLVFKDLDVWCHRSYDGRLDGTVARHYELLDATLGRLLEAAGPNTDVVLMSDHGFAAYQRSFFVEPWLVQQGFAAPSGARAGLDPRRSANLAEERVLEHRLKLELLDLPRTAAYALACEANYGSIRLNVAGREPSGALDPAQVGSKLREISEALLAWRAPGRDDPIVTRVLRTAELYPGPYSARLPDLIFELDPSVCARSNLANVPYGEHSRAFPDHHLEGIWIAAGPSFARRGERGRVSVFDLAPTALALLRLPVYAEMSGAVREELLAAPVDVRRTPEAGDRELRGVRPAFVEQRETDPEEVKRRLRETGYAE